MWTISKIAERVRAKSCLAVEKRTLLEAVGKQRVGARTKELIEAELLKERIALGSPVRRDDQEKDPDVPETILLYDDANDMVSPFFNLAKRIRSGEAFGQDVLPMRRAIKAAAGHAVPLQSEDDQNWLLPHR